MAQPVETATILNAQPFKMLIEKNGSAVRALADGQADGHTDGRTDGRYQTYYPPSFAVDNEFTYIRNNKGPRMDLLF